jgi:hypothetical protein
MSNLVPRVCLFAGYTLGTRLGHEVFLTKKGGEHLKILVQKGSSVLLL